MIGSGQLDETHDPGRRSFVESANIPDSDFPIQNLPLGVFSTAADTTPRIGVAIGNCVLDLKKTSRLNVLPAGIDRSFFEQTSLNALFGRGRSALRELRFAVASLLDQGASGNEIRRRSSDLLVPEDDCVFHRPTDISNYTDFYAGIYHAIAAGALLTPENPLPQNYKWMPIAYHGRASSVQIGRGEIQRPLGQRPPDAHGAPPSFGPCERLDFELEMGFYVGGGNELGKPIPIGRAAQEIVGFSLLNDWSARDIQRWEMYPLGPFLSKSFATSVSPWVVTADALAPFRVPALERPEGDPRPLSYLFDRNDQSQGGLDVHLEVYLSTEKMRRANQQSVALLNSNARYLYWTPAQMIAHHTANGCNLQPGDLIGTGTISGPTPAELSSMLEFTRGGAMPVTLSNGEQRSFLLDGDEISFRGRCDRAGHAAIGFGACTGRIVAAEEIKGS
ncbi:MULTISPECIES: fumarylacetoacetase [Bradyrhizobium]|uniref:fumarylacetoacetase n=1 Tax=Bradyrhizobium canariense TaxID=255045 RepID=A0A1X3FY18_9BRAD|nr:MULTISPECIES: fumarylacetoacetase [Bradyrhizobium]OSI71587.1 fumarylacetoacetase [Bradyrhizobium canariense]OSI80550.1 fumarylacetoacetase [Bradyrhizobium canariense]OSI91152.1 fumarylacetoacetase [Bradyrhizobium canariense]OSI96901.1 fumarylacetoacetase [Bradyrhizobium canariense]OSJ09203.1 fumarylacetoacetase [Bradyrhizobium canariense]